MRVSVSSCRATCWHGLCSAGSTLRATQEACQPALVDTTTEGVPRSLTQSQHLPATAHANPFQVTASTYGVSLSPRVGRLQALYTDTGRERHIRGHPHISWLLAG